MNSSLVLADYHQRSTNLRSKILKNEEQRVELERKLRSMSSVDSRLRQRHQVQQIQSYFSRLNQESQRAEQRNLGLLNELTVAEQHLDKLRIDAEQLLRLKNDYQSYLESNYPNWSKPVSTGASSNVGGSEEYDRLEQHLKQNDGNLRQSVPIVRQSYEVDSSILVKRYEDQLKGGFDRTISPAPVVNNEVKSPPVQQQDEHSLSEQLTQSHESANTFSTSKRAGSLRMELNRSGLEFLLDYIDQELTQTLDQKKFYRQDPPTISQKRSILDIANERRRTSVKDLDATTVSMVVLDQLPATIRRYTVHKCLFTDEILSANIRDLDKDVISQMLPAQDRSLWIRLIDHFTRLLKLHIMSSQTLANKFAPSLLPNNVLISQDKAKSLLKYIIEKIVGPQSSSSDDEFSSEKNGKKTPAVQHIIKPTTTTSSSPWLDKLATGGGIDEDDESSSSATLKVTNRSSSTPRATEKKEDSDLEFYS